MAPGKHPINGGESDLPPESEADRAFRVERDAEENRDSALPEDEEIRIVSFTVSEVYTPSTIDGLVDGVQALGWVRDEKFNPRFTNLIDWIGQSRSAPFGGGWVNLSYISDTTGRRPLGGSLQASMPAGVQEIWGQVHSVTPALTALVLQFVLDERTSKSLNPLFAEERVTLVERMSSGWAYIGPANQRTELVVAERRRIRAACHGWIRDHVPGSFSAAGSDMDLPTIETFVCDETKPFESIDRGVRTDYRMVLNIDADIDAFESAVAWVVPVHVGLPVVRWSVHDPSRWSVGGCVERSSSLRWSEQQCARQPAHAPTR